MPKFLAVFTGTASGRERSGWNAMDAAARSEREASGMQAWGEWMAANAASIVDAGGPLGGTMKIDATGIANVSNYMAGYVIVQADSHDAAARKFLNHPHFSIFPGDGVEVMECLPTPGA